MTTETSRIIATKIMGWTVSTDGKRWIIDDGLETEMIFSYFDPEHDIEQAVEAALKLVKGKGTFGDSHSWSWGVELFYMEDGDDRTGWNASVAGYNSKFHETPAAAITAALIAAVEETDHPTTKVPGGEKSE